jgi:hypothetical protein
MLAIEKAFFHQLAVLCDHCTYSLSFARDVCKRCMYHTVSTCSYCSDKTCSFHESCGRYPPHFFTVWGRTALLMLALSVSVSWHQVTTYAPIVVLYGLITCKVISVCGANEELNFSPGIWFLYLSISHLYSS